MTKKKEDLGRPTKYQKKFCKMLIDHMSAGYSYETFAAVIDVAVSTIYKWEKDFAEFSEAKRQAFNKNRMFWEKNGIEGMWSEGSSKFNSTAWIFNMKNRFGWSDKKEDEDTQKIHTVKIELPGQSAQQVISMEPKKIEGAKDGSS